MNQCNGGYFGFLAWLLGFSATGALEGECLTG